MTATPKRVLIAAITTGALVVPAQAQAHGMTCQKSSIHYKQAVTDSRMGVARMPGAVCVVLGMDRRTGRGVGLRFSAWKGGRLYSRNIFIVPGATDKCVDEFWTLSCVAWFRTTPLEVR